MFMPARNGTNGGGGRLAHQPRTKLRSKFAACYDALLTGQRPWEEQRNRHHLGHHHHPHQRLAVPPEAAPFRNPPTSSLPLSRSSSATSVHSTSAAAASSASSSASLSSLSHTTTTTTTTTNSPPSASRRAKASSLPRQRYYADLLCLRVEPHHVAALLDRIPTQQLLDDDDAEGRGADVRDNVGSLWRESLRVWCEADVHEDEVRVVNAIDTVYALSAPLLARRLPNPTLDLIHILCGTMDDADESFESLVDAIDSSLRGVSPRARRGRRRGADAHARTYDDDEDDDDEDEDRHHPASAYARPTHWNRRGGVGVDSRASSSRSPLPFAVRRSALRVGLLFVGHCYARPLGAYFVRRDLLGATAQLVRDAPRALAEDVRYGRAPATTTTTTTATLRGVLHEAFCLLSLLCMLGQLGTGAGVPTSLFPPAAATTRTTTTSVGRGALDGPDTPTPSSLYASPNHSSVTAASSPPSSYAHRLARWDDAASMRRLLHVAVAPSLVGVVDGYVADPRGAASSSSSSAAAAMVGAAAPGPGTKPTGLVGSVRDALWDTVMLLPTAAAGALGGAASVAAPSGARPPSTSSIEPWVTSERAASAGAKSSAGGVEAPRPAAAGAAFGRGEAQHDAGVAAEAARRRPPAAEACTLFPLLVLCRTNATFLQELLLAPASAPTPIVGRDWDGDGGGGGGGADHDDGGGGSGESATSALASLLSSATYLCTHAASTATTRSRSYARLALLCLLTVLRAEPVRGGGGGGGGAATAAGVRGTRTTRAWAGGEATAGAGTAVGWETLLDEARGEAELRDVRTCQQKLPALRAHPHVSNGNGNGGRGRHGGSAPTTTTTPARGEGGVVADTEGAQDGGDGTGSCRRRYVLACSVLDVAVLFLRHNRSRALDVDAMRLALRLVQAVMLRLASRRVRLASYDWTQVWSSVVSLATFLGSRHVTALLADDPSNYSGARPRHGDATTMPTTTAGVATTPLVDLASDVATTLKVALVCSDRVLDSTHETRMLLFEVARGAESLRRMAAVAVAGRRRDEHGGGPHGVGVGGGSANSTAGARASNGEKAAMAPEYDGAVRSEARRRLRGWSTVDDVLVAIDATLLDRAKAPSSSSSAATGGGVLGGVTGWALPSWFGASSVGNGGGSDEASGRAATNATPRKGTPASLDVETVMRILAASIDLERLLPSADDVLPPPSTSTAAAAAARGDSHAASFEYRQGGGGAAAATAGGWAWWGGARGDDEAYESLEATCVRAAAPYARDDALRLVSSAMSTTTTTAAASQASAWSAVGARGTSDSRATEAARRGSGAAGSTVDASGRATSAGPAWRA